jgi:hypothetical protein
MERVISTIENVQKLLIEPEEILYVVQEMSKRPDRRDAT